VGVPPALGLAKDKVAVTNPSFVHRADHSKGDAESISLMMVIGL
jgi:hypothetical protein